jgi:hypothetical protein
MKLLTVIAATAAAAAVAAALTTPAGADRSAGDKATGIATCLHAHGAADAPSGTDGLALKQWMAAHADSTAIKTCMPEASGPTELLACLRAHGLTPPGNVMQLKPWMIRESGSATGKATLAACGVNFDQPRSSGGPKKAPASAKDCGGATVAPAPKPE